jgi:NADPH:quinone reductase-like Zn-dependent oxidoreductase
VGGPGKLQVRDAPDPLPGDGEVRIRVRAAGVNFADILAREGLYPDAPKLPAVVGYEVSGVVDALGAGADGALRDQEVFALTRFGGYAEYVVVAADQAIPKPETLSHAQAAAIPVNYLTAWQLLVVMGSLKPTESVLIHNAGGGVGLAAIDIARRVGATIYGTASPGKHAFLKDRGLDFPIDYRTSDWSAELDRLTQRRGVELITDPIGGANWRKSYRALRATGRLGMFGASTATESKLFGPLRFLSVAVNLPWYNPVMLMNRNRSVFGVNLGHLWHEPEKIREWTGTLVQGVADGWVRPHVDKTFSFAQAGEAHAYISARNNIGKVVLIP